MLFGLKICRKAPTPWTFAIRRSSGQTGRAAGGLPTFSCGNAVADAGRGEIARDDYRHDVIAKNGVGGEAIATLDVAAPQVERVRFDFVMIRV